MNKVSKDNFKQDSYKYGFVTDIESETIPRGLNEDIVRIISNKKNEPKWMLEWRLKAFHRLKSMKIPKWAKVEFEDIDLQSLYYYSSPKGHSEKPKSLDEVDPKLLETYNKLGIPLTEQKMLAGVENKSIFVRACLLLACSLLAPCLLLACSLLAPCLLLACCLLAACWHCCWLALGFLF